MKNKFPTIVIYTVIIAVLAIGVGAVFSPLLHGFFLADDFDQVFSVKGLGPMALGARGNIFFRPMVSVTLYFNYITAGLNPVPYHLTNLGIHIANAVLVGIVSQKLIREFDLSDRIKKAIVYLSGLTFLLIPCHSESVAWIAGRSDLIAVLFSLCAFVVYLQWTRSRRVYLFCASLVLFLFGLLAKESVFIFPAIVFLHQIYLGLAEYKKNNLRRSLIVSGAYGIVFLLYLGLRFWRLQLFVGGYGKEIHLNSDLNFISRNFIRHIGRTFFPPMEFIGPRFWEIAFVIFCALLVLSVYRYWRDRALQMPLLLALLVSISIIAFLPGINIGIATYSTSGERFLYFSSVFAAIVSAIVIVSICRNLKTVFLVYTCLFLFWGTSLYHLNQRWENAGNVARSVIETLDGLAGYDRVFIVSLPDSLDDAYIFRSGLANAYHLFHIKKIPRDERPLLKVVALAAIKTEETETIVTPSDRQTYHIEMSDPSANIIEFPPYANELPRLLSYEIANLAGHEYDLTFSDLGDRDLLMYYENGRMVSSPPADR